MALSAEKLNLIRSKEREAGKKATALYMHLTCAQKDVKSHPGLLTQVPPICGNEPSIYCLRAILCLMESAGMIYLGYFYR